MTDSAPPRNVILVVGDWVVDEYWFLVRHHSEISSHTGFVHYRVASDAGDPFADLCGAGHVARALYGLRRRARNIGVTADYQLWGLGEWHPEDTRLLQHLVHSAETPGCGAARAAFHLHRDLCSEGVEMELAPLHQEGATIRVVRLYHQERRGLDQINRIDWESERQQDPRDTRRIPWDRLHLPEPETVWGVVIHDLQKGAVSEELIRGLWQRFGGARWFVRSKGKGGSPRWLGTVESQLEVLVIGPEVAAQLNPWDRWLVSGRITRQGLDAIQGHPGKGELPGKVVVLLSEQRELLARLKESDRCITCQMEKPAIPLARLGWPSALLAGLIHRLYLGGPEGELHKQDFQEALKWSEELAGVPLPRRYQRGRPETPEPQPSDLSWSHEQDLWDDALRDTGIIEDSDGYRLEVWRGSTLLPGYIALMEKKQEIISRICQHLRAFRRAGAHRTTLSVLLQADPGAGKTYLARCLAETFNFTVLRFDITQMLHREELLDLFDQVATQQASNRDLLVFVDEINAKLDNGPVYGAFLSPLEAGVYVRRGHLHTLRPCVWIFAGTKLDTEPGQAADKFEDFRSRMTLHECLDYGSLASGKPPALEKQARLEQVYLGASLIRAYFTDVEEVSREVLEHFRDLNPAEAPARTIRRLAASLKNVQHGRVTRDNCERWERVSWSPKPSARGSQPVRLIFE